MNESQIILRAEDLELALAPAIGGSIARFDRLLPDGERIPILRHAGPEASDALAMGSFPMVPYCNRIRGGTFTFRGREVRIAPNMSPDPSPLHGDGWLASWSVERSTEREAILAYRHRPAEWPWAYEAIQHFILDERGLGIRLTCRNLSDESMPCGLGQHPYFPCNAATELDTRVSHAWTIDDKVLPVEKVAAAGRYDLVRRAICGQDLDNGFAGWSGEAWIRDPAMPFSIRIASPDASFFQVYSPPTGGIVVAEPASHANAALNEPEESWAELGMQVVEPGEEMALHARIDVVPAGEGSV
jgi:aldose 1-epimerase